MPHVLFPGLFSDGGNSLNFFRKTQTGIVLKLFNWDAVVNGDKRRIVKRCAIYNHVPRFKSNGITKIVPNSILQRRRSPVPHRCVTLIVSVPALQRTEK